MRPASVTARQAPMMPTAVGERMAFDEPLRLAITLVCGVVAINDADQRHLGVIRLFQLLLHLLDPDILVRRLRRGREDGDLALAADGFGDHADIVGANQIVVWRIDLHRPSLGRDPRVEGQNGDPALHRLFCCRDQRVRVIGGDEQNVDMLCDQRIDDSDLLLDGRRGRARIDQFDVAELLRRHLPAVAPDVEVVDAEHLDDHGDAELLLREGCSRKLRKRRAGRQSGSQAFRDLSAIKVHCLVLPGYFFVARVDPLEPIRTGLRRLSAPGFAQTKARHTSGTNPKPVARRSIWPIAGKSKWVPATRILSVAAMSRARFRVAIACSRSMSSTVPAWGAAICRLGICTTSPQIMTESHPDSISQAVWPGVCPAWVKAVTPGNTGPSRMVRMRSE